MRKQDAENICYLISLYKLRSTKYDNLKTWIEEQRDKSVLPTTKAIYQSILDRMEESQNV